MIFVKKKICVLQRSSPHYFKDSHFNEAKAFKLN